MTELIRLGVQKVCQSVSREEKKALEIFPKFGGIQKISLFISILTFLASEWKIFPFSF